MKDRGGGGQGGEYMYRVPLGTQVGGTWLLLLLPEATEWTEGQRLIPALFASWMHLPRGASKQLGAPDPLRGLGSRAGKSGR